MSLFKFRKRMKYEDGCGALFTAVITKISDLRFCKMYSDIDYATYLGMITGCVAAYLNYTVEEIDGRDLLRCGSSVLTPEAEETLMPKIKTGYDFFEKEIECGTKEGIDNDGATKIATLIFQKANIANDNSKLEILAADIKAIINYICAIYARMKLV